MQKYLAIAAIALLSACVQPAGTTGTTAAADPAQQTLKQIAIDSAKQNAQNTIYTVESAAINQMTGYAGTAATGTTATPEVITKAQSIQSNVNDIVTTAKEIQGIVKQ